MFSQNDIVFQLFLGRHPEANILDHPHQVLARLKDFPWQKLASRGISHVYLLGLWNNQGPIIVTQESQVDLSDPHSRTPSIFSITNHTQVNPLLGTEQEFRELLEPLIIHHT